MASKRKAPASSSEPNFDRKRFLSFEKEKFFTKILEPLDSVTERRIIFNEGVYDELGIQEVLEKRKWKTLCMPNTEACAITVKEFYANCHWDDLDNPPEDNLYESFSRGCYRKGSGRHIVCPTQKLVQ